jgi:predicted permease
MAAAKFPMNSGLSRTLFEDARIAPRLRPLKDLQVGNVRGTLWVLMATVGILLAIACANVANLMLVRMDARRQELATRAALGAGAWRIARELMLESVLVSCAGGVLGVAIAAGAVRWFTASAALHLPRMEEISIDPAVLAFAACLSLVTGILFGLAPAYRYARSALSMELRSRGRLLTESRDRLRARGILVSAQVALALVLLVGAGLMVRTALALHRVDPGFSGAAEVQTIRIGIPSTQVKDPESVTRMEEEIVRKIEAIAGVSKAAMVSWVPMDGGSNDPVYAEDWSPQGGTPPIRRFKFISPGYVSVIGSHLVAGRDLTWADLYNRAPVALISENLAREFWRSPEAAIGKHVRPGPKMEWKQVIGVVADLRDDGIDRPAPAIVYWPLLMKLGTSDTANRNVVYVIRSSRAGSTALSQEIRQAVTAVNASLPLAEVKTLQSVYEQSLARTSFTLMLLAIAGGMALLLGVVGIYGTISFSVAQRTREVGIRLALGSPPRDVTAMFVRQGLAEAGAGMVCGLAAAFALTRLMESVLYGVSTADPATYLAASTALVAAAALASYLPAHRATRISPVEALRAE